MITPPSTSQQMRNKYLLWTGVNTCAQMTASTLASGSLLGKLNILGNYTLMLYNYIGRDACGQLGGAMYAMYKGGKIKDQPRTSGINSNNLINFSILST